MSNNLSNNIKACIFIGDMLQPQMKITKESVYTLQTFFYQTARRKDEQSIPYGPPMQCVIEFTLRTLPDGYMKKIYEALQCKEEQTISVLMNVFFQNNEEGETVMNDYESAFVISGYIIGVEENYNSNTGIFRPVTTLDSSNNSDLMLTRISLLINTINYVGSNEKNVFFYLR